MSAKITTEFGHAVPPAPRHAVTVHMGSEWSNAVEFGADALSVVAKFKNAYPRTKPHGDIVQLSEAVLRGIGATGRACLLFPSLQSAQQCAEYATSDKRKDDGIGKRPLRADELMIRAFVARDPFLAVIFPSELYRVVAGFWSTVGVGVSSRFAEANLAHLGELRQVSLQEAEAARGHFDSLAHDTIRTRILSLIKRAPLHPHLPSSVAARDIYLYQSGMASIYKPHSYMMDYYQGTSVLFGMAFMDTLVTLEQFGTGSKFFGLGSDENIFELEAYLRESQVLGRKVQAIWVEFPANPLLVCPDIARLRKLATEYDVVLGIDDTIGSWANIDVLAMADILVTSTTKSFNGYADAIGGTAILNPASHKYTELKSLFDASYVPEVYIDDAQAIEKNSRDYLARSARLNSNGSAVAEYLASRAQDPRSAVSRVHYPSVNASGDNYRRFMRPKTPDFTPGYGCVLSVELQDLSTARAFYDNLNVHKSVHLGAPFTLAFAYTMCAYQKKLEWAAQFCLKPTQIRISVGLEDTQTLVEDFRIAVEAADQAKVTAEEGHDPS
ncbi:putative cystathionine gamma-synthase [Metarhizium anisopliae]